MHTYSFLLYDWTFSSFNKYKHTMTGGWLWDKCDLLCFLAHKYDFKGDEIVLRSELLKSECQVQVPQKKPLWSRHLWNRLLFSIDFIVNVYSNIPLMYINYIFFRKIIYIIPMYSCYIWTCYSSCTKEHNFNGSTGKHSNIIIFHCPL